MTLRPGLSEFCANTDGVRLKNMPSRRARVADTDFFRIFLLNRVKEKRAGNVTPMTASRIEPQIIRRYDPEHFAARLLRFEGKNPSRIGCGKEDVQPSNEHETATFRHLLKHFKLCISDL